MKAILYMMVLSMLMAGAVTAGAPELAQNLFSDYFGGDRGISLSDGKGGSVNFNVAELYNDMLKASPEIAEACQNQNELSFHECVTQSAEGNEQALKAYTQKTDNIRKGIEVLSEGGSGIADIPFIKDFLAEAV